MCTYRFIHEYSTVTVGPCCICIYLIIVHIILILVTFLNNSVRMGLISYLDVLYWVSISIKEFVYPVSSVINIKDCTTDRFPIYQCSVGIPNIFNNLNCSFTLIGAVRRSFHRILLHIKFFPSYLLSTGTSI